MDTQQEDKATVNSDVKEWFDRGLNVLPTNDKRPLVKWEEWQTKRQTYADIQAMPWSSANGFAVVCGLSTTITYGDEQKEVYLGVIDIDDKETFDFSKFPETFIEKTPHGFHMYYWSECPVEPIKYKGFELLGQGNICCIYNNPHNNLPIAVQFDIKAQFEHTCKHLGISNSKNNSLLQSSKATLNELLEQDAPEGQRDNTAILIASKLRSKGKTQPEVLEILLDWNQKHCLLPLTEEIIAQKVESAFKTERPYFDNKKDTENQRFTTISKATFEIANSQPSDNGLYESILVNDKPCFLQLYSPNANGVETKLFALKTHVEIADVKERWTPKDTTLEALPFHNIEDIVEINLANLTYTVPTAQNLFDRIVSTLKTYVNMQDDFFTLCALMVMLTYEQHKFNWVPYLGIFGDTGSGKSALTELMSNLSYRCGYFTEVNSANIYQYLSEYKGTVPCLAEDEIQGFEKDTEKIKIYKSGNSKSGRVPRILTTPTGRQFLVYPTYCFKILAGEQVPTVKGLNERTLAINMSKGRVSKNWYDRTEEDIAKIKKLKWDLLKWRMANYGNQYLSNVQATSRIENNLKPLRAIAKGLSIEQDFENWCNDAIQKSQSEKKETLEGCVVESVYNLVNSGLFESEVVLQGQEVTKIYLNFDELWNNFKKITFATNDFADKVQTNDFGEVTKNRIGRVLTNIFGSKSITRNQSNVKIRCRVFEVRTLLNVVSNYFDEEEAQSINQKIQSKSKQP